MTSEYKRGHLSFGEWLPDINSIALAFRPGPGLPAVTLSCTGPNAIMAPEQLLEAVRPLLRERVQRIEAAPGAPRT